MYIHPNAVSIYVCFIFVNTRRIFSGHKKAKNEFGTRPSLDIRFLYTI